MLRKRYRFLKLICVVSSSGSTTARITDISYAQQPADDLRSRPPGPMTSNSAPFPYRITATTDSANAYLAFDNSSATYWSPGTDSVFPQSITLDCGKDRRFWIAPTNVKLAQISLAGRRIRLGDFYGSVNGISWDFLGTTGLYASDTMPTDKRWTLRPRQKHSVMGMMFQGLPISAATVVDFSSFFPL